MEKGSSSAISDDDHDLYSSIEVKPDWSNFDILVAVAEKERIKLEKEKKEIKLRQNLSTPLKILDERETKDSIKNPNIDEKKREESVKNLNRVVKLQIPIGQNSSITKGKRSLGEKRSSLNTLLFKNFSQIPPLLELEGSKHQEEDDYGNNNNGNILFSSGGLVKKSFKKLRCNDEKTHQEENMPRPKKAKITNNHLAGPSIMPTTIIIPEQFKNKILELGGSESSIVFVFQKVLTKTDVNPHHRRLLIPFKQLKNEFLTDEEKNCFQIRKQKYEINAVFIEPSLDDCRINLKQWDMPKDSNTVSHNFTLITHWTDVVRRNQLKEGMTVHLWAFRKGSQLGLALVLVN